MRAARVSRESSGRMADMARTHRPWPMNTWWGRLSDIVSVSLVAAVLALILWKSLWP
jgi:hypothetical protein